MKDLSYFDWLMSIVDVSQNDSEYDVAILLSMIPYRWRHPLDRNWALKGYYLRGEYQDLYSVVDEDMRQDETSVLEVLICLATSIAHLTVDVSPGQAYRELMRNLHLTSSVSKEVLQSIIFAWMDGYQDEHAYPGPMPVYAYKKDARNLDLTSLLNDYISENHPHDPNWLSYREET